MLWDWPIISAINKKLFPDEKPEITPEPQPPTPAVPPLTAPDTPQFPKPGFLNPVNYLRALLILRNTPFKALWAEFLKLPLKQIAFVIGLFIWVYMTYNLLIQLILWLSK